MLLKYVLSQELSYVVVFKLIRFLQDPQTKQITDFCSFYSLPSTIIGNDKYKTLYAAYSFYNVATTTDLKTLMGDALVMAKKVCYSVHLFQCYRGKLTGGMLSAEQFRCF